MDSYRRKLPFSGRISLFVFLALAIVSPTEVFGGDDVSKLPVVNLLTGDEGGYIEPWAREGWTTSFGVGCGTEIGEIQSSNAKICLGHVQFGQRFRVKDGKGGFPWLQRAELVYDFSGGSILYPPTPNKNLVAGFLLMPRVHFKPPFWLFRRATVFLDIQVTGVHYFGASNSIQRMKGWLQFTFPWGTFPGGLGFTYYKKDLAYAMRYGGNHYSNGDIIFPFQPSPQKGINFHAVSFIITYQPNGRR